MPIGDRLRRRKRRIHDGDEYTIDQEDDIELEMPERRNAPPEDIQGEPWGWTKEGHKPIGYRPDGKYDNPGHDDPGPFDGKWERDGA